MKAMIFAAGLGTRLKEETADKPKALVEIGGKTFLQRAIEKLISAGVNEIVVNVHHFSEKIIAFLAEHNFKIPVHISDESGKLLETGGGLKYASSFFAGNESILIYNVDILSNLELNKLSDFHKQTGALATLVVRHRETQRYLKFNQQKELVGWLNKKTGETKISVAKDFAKAAEMAFSGIHIVHPEIFKYMPAKDRFSIIDLYLELAKSQKINGYFDDSELWMDIGKPVQLAEARKLFNS